MSDSEASSAIQEEEVTDLGSAVRRVLKNAFAADGVTRGLHEGMCFSSFHSCNANFLTYVQGVIVQFSIFRWEYEMQFSIF